MGDYAQACMGGATSATIRLHLLPRQVPMMEHEFDGNKQDLLKGSVKHVAANGLSYADISLSMQVALTMHAPWQTRTHAHTIPKTLR